MEQAKELIQKLKKQLDVLLSIAEHPDALRERREEIEKELLKLQDWKRDAFRSLDPKKTDSPLIEEKIQQMKQTQQDLDHLIDEVDHEHDYENRIRFLREQLIQAILEHRPQERSIYEQKEETLRSQQEAKTAVVTLYELCQQIKQPLEAAIANWQMSRGRSFLAYIFGRSPAVTITSYLEKVATQCGATLSWVDRMAEELPLSAPVDGWLPELRETIETLQDTARKEWGAKTFRDQILPLNEALVLHLNRLKQAKTQTEEASRMIQREIFLWMEDQSAH